MKIGSLFSGVGGIERGFEQAGGFETIWFVENEPYAQAVLKKHWPNTPIYGDIKKIDFTKIEQSDILTGGFPCQDISNAGQRKGIEGKRSGLWKEFLRAISQIRPKYALVENVSALTYRGLLTVLGDLTEIGYDAEWHCLPASAIGAAHRRDRIYIMAYSNNNRCLYRQTEKHTTQTREFAQCNTSTKSIMENSKCNGTDERNRQKNNSRKKSQQHSNKLSGTSTRSGNERKVPNSNFNRREQMPNREFSKKSTVRGKIFSQRQKEMANSNSKVLSGSIKNSIKERQPEEKTSRRSNSFPNTLYINHWKQRKEILREKNRQETWATDTRILRVAHGIPNRIHRIKCIGNAVVPQCAEFFAEIIKEKEGL